MQQRVLDQEFNRQNFHSSLSNNEEKDIRIIRKAKKRWLCISNYFLNMKNLSQRAKGLHLYILSKPDDWKFIPKEVENKHGRKRDYVNTPYKELIDNNIWYRDELRNEEGRYIEHVTLIFENGYGFINDKLIHGKKRIFRAERTENYTILPFDHIEDGRISLEAKNIHSYVLSKPNHWKVTIDDLVESGKESYKAISTFVKELYKYNYWQKFPVYKNGKIDEYVTLVYEEPFSEDEKIKNIIYKNDVKITNYKSGLSKVDPINISLDEENKSSDESIDNTDIKLVSDSLELDKPKHTYPLTGVITEHKSLSIKDDRIDESFSKEDIKKQIEYDALVYDGYNKSNLDIAVKVIQSVLNSKKEVIRVSSSIIPADNVKEEFKKLDQLHMQYFFECLHEQEYKIRNTFEYFKTSLYNAPSTIEQYYKQKIKNFDYIEESDLEEFNSFSKYENAEFKKTPEDSDDFIGEYVVDEDIDILSSFSDFLKEINTDKSSDFKNLDDTNISEGKAETKGELEANNWDLSKETFKATSYWEEFKKTLSSGKMLFLDSFIDKVVIIDGNLYIYPCYPDKESVKHELEKKYLKDIKNFFNNNYGIGGCYVR